VDWIYLAHYRISGSFESGNEHSGSVKAGNALTS
jgi:hypothetical protein